MRLFKWLIGLVITLAAIAALAPLASKWYLVHWFEQQGYQAQLKRVSFDYIFGKISLTDLQLRSAQGQSLNLLTLEADIDLASLLSATVAVEQLKLVHLKADVQQHQGHWLLGGFAAERLGQWLGDKQLNVDLTQLEFIEFCRTDVRQCLKIDELAVSRMRIAHDNDWDIKHDGPLRIQKMFLVEPNKDAALFFAEQAQWSAGQWRPEALSLTDLTGNNWQISEVSQTESGQIARSQTQLGELSVKSVRWLEGVVPSVNFGAVKMTSLRQLMTNPQSLTHEKMKANLAFWLAPIERAINALESGELRLRIDEFDLSDGALSWSDYSVTPAAIEQATQIKWVSSGLDSTTPEQPTRLQLSFRFGVSGQVKLEAELFPYSNPPTLTGEGLLQDLQLANFSAYTEHLLGTHLLSGVVDVGFTLDFKEDTLSGDTLWRLTQLRFADNSSTTRDMPLSLSFDVLQDHNASVPFELPLSMRGDRGQLSLKTLFNQIRRKLNTMAARELNPAGAVALRPKNAGQPKMAFRPLMYGTRARQPLPEDTQRLDDIVKLLKGKEHLSMVFCPVTTGGEWAEIFNGGEILAAGEEILPEQRKELINLAQIRGRVLQSMLLEKGLQNKQIVVCGPAVDLQQTGASYVTLSL